MSTFVNMRAVHRSHVAVVWMPAARPFEQSLFHRVCNDFARPIRSCLTQSDHLFTSDLSESAFGSRRVESEARLKRRW